MAIKVYHNVTTFPFLANIKLYDNKLYVTIKAPSATVEGKYTTLGTDYIPISEHSSYSIIMRNNDALYKIRDDKNSVVQSKIKLVPSNKIMMGSRMKYDEVENRYDGVSLLQIDTNTFNGNVSELQVVLFRVKKENLTFEIPTSMKVEYTEYNSSDIFKKGAKRHYFWDTYALIINGKEYVRLLCGAGNARRNTVFFVQRDIYEPLDKILRNGHKPLKITESKYNAYYALSNSATYSVSEPRVCVVPDKEIQMVKKVDWVTENEPDDIIEEQERELTFNLWDGMGICSPELAEKWAQDLELDYVPCSFCIRNYFVKGMVCVFDFHKFSREVAHKNIITDLYGNEVNTDDIDMIITESQFKLWKGYTSWQDYLDCCKENDGDGYISP